MYHSSKIVTIFQLKRLSTALEKGYTITDYSYLLYHYLKTEKKENSYSRFRKSFTRKIIPHARQPINPSPGRGAQTHAWRTQPRRGGEDRGRSEQAVCRPLRAVLRYPHHPSQIQACRQTYCNRSHTRDGAAHPHSNASESVLAHIATAKYHDHPPLHRQLEIFEREGVRLSASTVSNSMMATTKSREYVLQEVNTLQKPCFQLLNIKTNILSYHLRYPWHQHAPTRYQPRQITGLCSRKHMQFLCSDSRISARTDIVLVLSRTADGFSR